MLPAVDWNPSRRIELPPCPTGSIAGSSAPVTLTQWKLRALDVLAELEIKGTITANRIRELGLNPSRWMSALWLSPAKEPQAEGDSQVVFVRGAWVRSRKCPKFDAQHPEAYARALAEAVARLQP
jgi:hypothetical protein